MYSSIYAKPQNKQVHLNDKTMNVNIWKWFKEKLEKNKVNIFKHMAGTIQLK